MPGFILIWSSTRFLDHFRFQKHFRKRKELLFLSCHEKHGNVHGVRSDSKDQPGGELHLCSVFPARRDPAGLSNLLKTSQDLGPLFQSLVKGTMAKMLGGSVLEVPMGSDAYVKTFLADKVERFMGLTFNKRTSLF